MRILELELQHFRNYSGQRVSFDPDCNVIFGENAQGKTNLLEAIVYLSCGKSPRARTDREMIAFDAPAAVLEAGISARDREFRTRVELYRDRRRKMWVNQVPAKNSAALSQVYHTVFFCPDDLYLIREGAAARRRFMDTALCQLRPLWRSTTGSMTTRPAFCGTVRSGRISWSCCRTLTNGWFVSAQCWSTTAGSSRRR